MQQECLLENVENLYEEEGKGSVRLNCIEKVPIAFLLPLLLGCLNPLRWWEMFYRAVSLYV